MTSWKTPIHSQPRQCVLKDEKPKLPIVLINEKGLISEGGLRDELMKDIQVCGDENWDAVLDGKNTQLFAYVCMYIYIYIYM